MASVTPCVPIGKHGDVMVPAKIDKRDDIGGGRRRAHIDERDEVAARPPAAILLVCVRFPGGWERTAPLLGDGPSGRGREGVREARGQGPLASPDRNKH
ncbi:hypothetical protein chiPu_0010223 [Chiloscyllium punctatum]|uniref:Uncharacterized protein n=1 Tax=Chiloscyllium punctatum TaxID=137246 RepID=A0A401SMY7_CHIPU|nr:hypothetical protein [Chiloscyllium punctatum]